MVAFFHACWSLEQAGLSHPLLDQINAAGRPIRMPMFFLISGMFAARLMARDWRTVLSRRCGMLGALFVIWTVIITLFTHLSGLEGGGLSRALSELARALYDPSTALWFLWALVIYTALTRALWSVRPLALGLGLVAFVYARGLDTPLSWTQINLFSYLVFFVAGAWFGPWIVRLVTGRMPWALAIAALFPLWAWLLQSQPEQSVARAVFALLGSVSGVMIGLLVARAISAVAPMRALFVMLGRNTLPIYVLHLTAERLIVAGVAPSLSPALPVLAPAAIMLTILGVAISLWLHRLSRNTRAAWLFAPSLPQPRPLLAGLGRKGP